jgi:hypothetical protein
VGKLSNRQSRRLAGLLALQNGAEPLDDILAELIADGFAAEGMMTVRGYLERERLLKLAGLHAEKGARLSEPSAAAG